MSAALAARRWAFVLLFGFFASVSSHASGCSESIGRDFESAPPGDRGISAARLTEVIDALDSGLYDVRALLILRDCKLILERYKEGVTRQHNHSLYSVTKSMSATLVAALLHQGKLTSLDAKISDLVPRPSRIDDANWSKASQITLKNSMQMASGLEYKHDPCCHPIYDTREDRFAAALLPSLSAIPGTKFLYSDGDASLVGAVIASAADEDLLSFAQSALFKPLNASNVDWMFRDRAGRYPGGWGLRLRPMDMLKVGQLYVQRGEWNGLRIFPADFVQLAWSAGVNPTYGLGWRIVSPTVFGTPYYWAQGFKGQRILVFPEWKVVVALSSSLSGAEESQAMRILVPGLVDAIRRGVDSDDRSLATFKSKEALGFRGDTKVQQEAQDAPRRF